MLTNRLHKALGRDETHKALGDANGLKTILSEQTGCIDTYARLIHFFRMTEIERTGHVGILPIDHTLMQIQY
jgi:hypothetical protein